MKTKKIVSVIVFSLLGLMVIVFCYFFVGNPKPVEQIEVGVTFSKIQAENMGLNWKEVYLAVLDDLGFKKIRLSAYWPEIEPEKDRFKFEDLDWQIEEASKRNVEIILAVGQRLPRWPECHIPSWAEKLKKEERQERLLNLITKIVNRYKGIKAIKYWQVENEPFLRTFGECPKLDKKFLDREIALVRKLDSSRKIIMTESGEFSTWIGAARRGDILGTTLYRRVYGKLGYVKYPLPPVFYARKSLLIKKFFPVEKIIVIELQAEPWGPAPIQDLSIEEQYKTMSPEKFKEIIEYTKKSGFSEAYLWGVEWWYWLKVKHNNNDMWDSVKVLLNKNNI